MKHSWHLYQIGDTYLYPEGMSLTCSVKRVALKTALCIWSHNTCYSL